MNVTAKDQSTIEQRIQRLEDIEEIKHLKARYVKCCDDGYDAELFASFFTEEGCWTGPEGTHTGRKSIADFIESIKPEMKWTYHYPMSPIFDFAVDGNSAKVIWYAHIIQSVQGLGEGDPLIDMVNFAQYHDVVERVGGQWQFSRVEPVPSRSWDMTGAAWRGE